MRTQRIRDPIHDIISFDETGLVDEAVWELLQTPDLQRLRRIKQLGLSEFVFPSATHTRFSHSVGVFHVARRLVGLIKREIAAKRVDGAFDDCRAKVALFAALLHDIGHGPFSHAFEEARKALSAPKVKIMKHEEFTAQMIEDPSGQISEILRKWGVKPQDVANLIRSEVPDDMYHAVVSSSFDADRLDYLVRDRYMTGTGAGAIDLEWLMDNVRVADIDLSSVGAEDDPVYRHSFCLGYKARDAAEDFLLARYRLYTNVYFHKRTRGIEQLVSLFFKLVATEAGSAGKVAGLPDEHPLVRFFAKGGESLANYRMLDDTVVWGALHSTALSGSGETKAAALRILNRERMACLDVQNSFPDDKEKQRRLKKALDEKFKNDNGTRVFRDVAKLTLYGEVGADDTRAQKRLMIQLANGSIKEITDLHDGAIVGTERQRSFERYYFLDDSTYASAQAVAGKTGRQ